MPKVLMILPQQNFNDVEYSQTRLILDENGIEVTTASITADVATSMTGMRTKPEKAVRGCRQNDYDGLVIVGGTGSPKLLNYPEILVIVRRFNEVKKPVAAICLAPTILANAGILNGVKATVYPADWAIAALKKNGAIYTPQPVVVDGNIITGDGPENVESFANAIIRGFKEFKPSV